MTAPSGELDLPEEFVSAAAVAARIPMTLLVDNADDSVGTVRYLNDLVSRGQPRRILLRPTPGTVTRSSIGHDLLLAMGKSLDILVREKLGPAAWDLAAAWVTGNAVSDIIVDRSHQLDRELVVDLAALGRRAGASVWLIWSSTTPFREMLRSLEEGFTPRTLSAEQMAFAMPGDIWLPDEDEWILEQHTGWTKPALTQWRDLPHDDFPMFLAAARRRLNAEGFELTERYYWLAFERTMAWLANHYDTLAPTPNGDPLGGELAWWLRDIQLGPVPYPQIALIVLRATQAALFHSGIWLCWSPKALGTEPHHALPGNLARSTRLTAVARTDAAAATALSLHLNQGPFYFDSWSCRDVEPDGSALYPPETRQAPPVTYINTDTHREAVRRSSNVEEIPLDRTVILPRQVHPVIAAHLAYRRQQGAGDDEPLFIHPRDPRKRAYTVLRPAILRTLEMLSLERHAPWMHHDGCRFGADVGLNERAQGWLIERGLSIHRAHDTRAAKRR